MGILYLWGDGQPGLAEPIEPEQLKAADTAWGELSTRWGGWSPAEWRGPTVAAAGWRAQHDVPGAPILVTGPASSCLDCAWHWLQAGGFPPGASVLSISQWAGRGQRGRSWVSPPGNLYAAWRVPLLPADADGPALSLRMGYAVSQVLRTLGLPALVKWPNDVVLDGAKVAGLLCEQRGGVLMLGLGVNLVSSPPREHLREAHTVPAGSLRQRGVALSPVDLWLRIRSAAEACLDRPPTVEAMENVLAYRGQRIGVQTANEPPFAGRILGVSAAGALRVATSSGERQLLSASLVDAPAADAGFHY